MSIPLRQSVRITSYLLRQKLSGNEKFPLLVELEPLYQCNLACAFCGKIQHPDHILRQRMPVEQAIAAIEESGAPMVSIAGGEPLVHPEVHVIAKELIKRKKFVFLCTNAILMKKKMGLFEPSPLLRVGRPPRRAAGATRPVRRAERCLRQGRRGDS